MTKKDFKLFAEMMVKLEDRISREEIEMIDDCLVGIFHTSNNRFDYDKWKEYKEKLRG